MTSRSDSLTADYCSKPDELGIRTDVFFRSDKFMFQHQICREKFMKYYMLLLLHKDRYLFKYYFLNKIEEIYPSRMSVLRDICKDKSLVYKIKFYLYFLFVWIRTLGKDVNS